MRALAVFSTRWFVLTVGSLSYYKTINSNNGSSNDSSSASSSTCFGRIKLRDCRLKMIVRKNRRNSITGGGSSGNSSSNSNSSGSSNSASEQEYLLQIYHPQRKHIFR